MPVHDIELPDTPPVPALLRLRHHILEAIDRIFTHRRDAIAQLVG